MCLMRRPRAGAARRSTVAPPPARLAASVPPHVRTLVFFLCTVQSETLTTTSSRNYDRVPSSSGVLCVRPWPAVYAETCVCGVTTLSFKNIYYIVLCPLKLLEVKLPGLLGTEQLVPAAHRYNLSLPLTTLSSHSLRITHFQLPR